MTPFHSRYYGRISEIIFNVWLDVQISEKSIDRSEIKELPIVHIGAAIATLSTVLFIVTFSVPYVTYSLHKI